MHSFVTVNWQLYQGSGRTKTAARRDAVQRALSCSVQLSTASIASNTVVNTTTDFTTDSPPINAQNESATTDEVFRCTSLMPTNSQSRSTDTEFTDTARQTSTDIASSRRRFWFNAGAVLQDVRPLARYKRQASLSSGVVHATVTVDGQCFEGFAATWRAAKRHAASQALRHILQLRYLTSYF